MLRVVHDLSRRSERGVFVRLKAAATAVTIAMLTACGGEGVLGPDARTPQQIVPHVSRNYITDQSDYAVRAYATLDNVNFVPHVNSYYEFEFRFTSSGWSSAHMEPRAQWSNPSSPGFDHSMTYLESVRAAPRIGTDDHISLQLCYRNYNYFIPRCSGDMWMTSDPSTGYINVLDEVRFGPQDSGVEKVVHLWQGDDERMLLRIRLDWTPVNVQVASVEVNGLLSVPAGSAHEYFGVARDANFRSIPGLPISWSSSDTRHASLASSGVAIAREPGTVGIVATIGGVSGTRMVDVNNDLGVTMSGETSPKTGQACRYYAEMNSSSSGDLTYEWREGWDSESAVLGMGSYFDRQFSPNESTRLMLRVRDGGGREGWAYLEVTADQSSGNDCGR
jgi:hypothetical protein